MKLLIATLLLLTAFMANADSDYLPKSSATPIYAPSYSIGWIQLKNDDGGDMFLYAPSILRVTETETTPVKDNQQKTTIYMIDGSVVYVSDTMANVKLSLMPVPKR